MYENYSVLFVDDEINILSSLRRGFLEEEFTCHYADTAMKAMDIIAGGNIHVLITDMRMPEMNGLELLKHVEANYPMMVKLVLSGYTQLPQVLATINQVDIFNFVTKPWNIEELIVIVHKALDYYILQEENAKYKKLLETKNQSYQNILKRIDDVVDNAKKTAELIRIFTNEILSYSKDFTKEERNTYYDIISKQYDIFNVLSKAASVDKKAFGYNQLLGLITEHITHLFPAAVIHLNAVSESTIFLNKQMLDAILSSIIILFHDEFTENGLYVNYGLGNRLLISVVSPNARKQSRINNNGTAIFDAKMAFIRNLTDKISDLCQITLQIQGKDDNLVIGFSFEEQ